MNTMHFTQLTSVKKRMWPQLHVGTESRDSGPTCIPGPNRPKQKDSPPIYRCCKYEYEAVLPQLGDPNPS